VPPYLHPAEREGGESRIPQFDDEPFVIILSLCLLSSWACRRACPEPVEGISVSALGL